MATPEQVYVVHWEGPFPWEQRKDHHHDESHVLYALHGAHHLYGRDVLLYIGRSDAGVGGRLDAHEAWVADEYDAMQVRFASVGAFGGWESWPEANRYAKADAKVVAAIEALLIFAHQPAYNSTRKAQAAVSRGIRIFNTGRLGHLHREISGLYQVGE